MVRGNTMTPPADVTTSQKENAMLQLIEDGPVKNVGQLFVAVLTVPQELRKRIFYWPEEREFCEHISSVGRALDTLTAVHRTFLGQFKVLSNLRASFIQSPTEFFVAPMYFCDRALDSLLRSTRKVQNDINELFKDLAELERECSWRYRWTKKSFLEDKYPKNTTAREGCSTRPDMEVKEQRVLLLAELSERIGTVRRGGSNVFSLVGRQWLPGYSHDIADPRSDDAIKITGGVDNRPQEGPAVDKGNGSAEMEVEGSESLRTPTPQYRVNIRSRLAQHGENPVEIPETPEIRRTGGVIKTQRSSPRNRKPSQSSGASELTGSNKLVQGVTRNLMGGGSADVLDSPAQKSGVSIETIRAVNERNEDVMVARCQVENDDLQVASDELESRKEPPSDARAVLHNPSEDVEKPDENDVCSPAI